jgi:ElaB/YqjD/DUF883 family membrane-anchored ribosome-binding protein
MRDKATQTVEQVKDKAQRLGTQAAEQADMATTAVGEKITGVAQTLREKAPDSGPVAQAVDTTAQTLERAGSYLQEQDLADMRAGVEELIRRYPMQAVLIGFGIGYLLGRSTGGSDDLR